MTQYYKLEVYVPATHAEELKAALAAAGGGELGNYDSCIWECVGVGQFRPLPGSTPFLGEEGVVEKVVEHKLELLVSAAKIKVVLAALKEAHPYETPAYQYWPVQLD